MYVYIYIYMYIYIYIYIYIYTRISLSDTNSRSGRCRGAARSGRREPVGIALAEFQGGSWVRKL